MSVKCVEEEQRCIISWFSSWEEEKKQAFLNCLLDVVCCEATEDSLNESVKLLSLQTSPTVFHAQLRLCSKWCGSWSATQLNEFLAKLAVKDPAFVRNFQLHIPNINLVHGL